MTIDTTPQLHATINDPQNQDIRAIMISNKIDYDNHDSGVYGKGGNNIPSYDID